MALNKIIYYYLLNSALKEVLKKHRRAVKKKTRKQKENARVSLLKRNLYDTNALLKARTKIKKCSAREYFCPRLVNISVWVSSDEKTEQLVLEIFARTNYDFRKIAKILKRQYRIKISYATVGNILKDLKLKTLILCF